jgi:hypothetical protein
VHGQLRGETSHRSDDTRKTRAGLTPTHVAAGRHASGISSARVRSDRAQPTGRSCTWVELFLHCVFDAADRVLSFTSCAIHLASACILESSVILPATSFILPPAPFAAPFIRSSILTSFESTAGKGSHFVSFRAVPAERPLGVACAARSQASRSSDSAAALATPFSAASRSIAASQWA